MTNRPAIQRKVALINPPFLPNYSRGQRSPGVTRSGTLYYPMWLAYAAAHVLRLGHEVLLLDAPASELAQRDLETSLQKFKPDLLLVETATPSIDSDLQCAVALKRLFPSSWVFVCGTHATALPADALNQAPEIDGVIIGEYEIPLEELLKQFCPGGNPDVREGLFVRGNTKPPVRTRFFENLDSRPFVSEIYKTFLPIPRYFNPNAHHPMVAILAGRGCPFACSYCVFPQTLMGNRYRQRSLDSLLEEFRWIEQNLPEVRGVFLEDDTFTANPARVREFCRRRQEDSLTLSWSANARADVDRDTLVAMKGAGLRALCVGFESGNQELLDGIGKGLTLERMLEFARNAASVGVKVHGCFMVGLPGETRQTLYQTLQFALQLPLDTAQFYPLMVYPGTRAYDRARAENLIVAGTFRDWLSTEGYHQCVVRGRDLSAGQLVRFCNHARRRFYLRKSWLRRMAWKALSDSEERHRLVLAAKTFMKHLLGDR